MINFVNVSIPIENFKDIEFLGNKVVYRFNTKRTKDTINAVECIVPKDSFDITNILNEYKTYKNRFYNIKLNRIKRNKLEEIDNYDSSNKINILTINNIKGWLNKQQRSGLYNLLNTNTNIITLWLGDNNIELDKETLKNILDQLEQYAYECYNITALHKQKVNELTNIDEIENYDITAYYPKSLNIKL